MLFCFLLVVAFIVSLLTSIWFTDQMIEIENEVGIFVLFIFGVTLYGFTLLLGIMIIYGLTGLF